MTQSSLDNPGCLVSYSPEWIEYRIAQMVRVRQEGFFPEFTYNSTYLKSPLWRKIRRRVMKRDNKTCVRCGDAAKDVHHLAYTEAVKKGEDDTQLASLCRACHREVEFDETGRRRSMEDKRRVFEERDRPQRERLEAIESERLYQEAENIYQEAEKMCRDAAKGRCYWCCGNTESSYYIGNGGSHRIPTAQGDHIIVWICSGCRSTLNYWKDGSIRSDSDKIKLLKEKADVCYTRPATTRGFRATDRFRSLNAMQQEGLRNEFLWNSANISGLQKRIARNSRSVKPAMKTQKRMAAKNIVANEQMNT